MSYVQNTDRDRKEMLGYIGVSSFDELIEPVARELRVKGDLKLGLPMSEAEVVSHCAALARRNSPASEMASFLGAGIYDRYIPATVRYVLSRSEFYTSYTPYQAEVSQGTLQAIYEYQTMITRLTAMDAANASMYDAATSLAESLLMACAIKRTDRVLVPAALSQRIRRVLESYSAGRHITIESIPWKDDGTVDLDEAERLLSEKAAAVILAQPNYFGLLEDASAVSSLAHGKGALLIALVDPVSLALVAPPGEYEADIAVGEGQSLGIPQSFGGPLLGFMATRKEYIRKCPGRLISATVDSEGKRGYVMTLQTREQHIRREKATSNICTNEGLCALAAAVYLSTMGDDGFREVALQSAAKSHRLYEMLSGLPGVTLPFGKQFFQEFVVRFDGPASRFLSRAKKSGILGGVSLEDDFPELGKGAVLVAVTEKRSLAELELFRDIAAGKEVRV
ncbi:MAG: aminomethyl-transferring glycine dehydrogenase subunit GcvPA [Candidatus Krumholzibacteriota bacterium]|nr:aminomethyl-transferring glycine dehydrogenase subunit GcvPA [Candidatus Krumholzibacteriota bacterium]